MKLAQLAAVAALSLGHIAHPSVARADAIEANGGDLSAQLASLPTGDQLVIENADGAVSFGGRTIMLGGFSGVAGYGSEIAYLIVIDGQAALGDMVVEKGRMVLIPPFGQEPGVQRFDARRLHDALSAQETVAQRTTVAMLDKLASAQDRGVFLGRLGRTSFNVATMGSAQAEMARRERVGSTTIRNARFVNDGAVTSLEERIVTGFLEALAARDSAAVAEMLDPLPYGFGSMVHGGDEARLAMASSLIAQRDWSAFAQASPQQVEETLWRAGAAVIGLRRTTEFAFIESIEVGS